MRLRRRSAHRLAAAAGILGLALGVGAQTGADPGADRERGGDGSSSPRVEPLQDIHFAACPCWLTSRELIEQIERIHSDISFECDVASGISSIEIKAFSSGVGGPFRSFVYTAQPRAVGDTRCRHVQTQPSLDIAASAGLRTPSERAACSTIVTNAATQLQCSGVELLE